MQNNGSGLLIVHFMTEDGSKTSERTIPYTWEVTAESIEVEAILPGNVEQISNDAPADISEAFYEKHADLVFMYGKQNFQFNYIKP
jgi:hypothetical protein